MITSEQLKEMIAQIEGDDPRSILLLSLRLFLKDAEESGGEISPERMKKLARQALDNYAKKIV